MRHRERLLKNNKKLLFTVEETKNLTGFTRSQLLTWEEIGIVLPERHPTIFYTWKQIILLRILFYWRKKASLQKIAKIFLDDNIDRFYEHLEISSLAMFNDQKLVFINDSFHEEQAIFSKIAKSLETINIEEIDYGEIIPGVVLLNIRSIVYNLKQAGEKLKIKNFALKVGERWYTDEYDFKVG